MTIRVFIGCAPDGHDAESLAVLEYTIRKHTKADVDIVFMMQSRDPASFWYVGSSGWHTARWATPFSGFRWGIPAYCGFAGKAIYMDSDVIVMRDLGELWNQAFEPGKLIIAKGGSPRICVSMWDCEAALAWLPAIDKIKFNEGSHQDLWLKLSNSPHLIQPFAPPVDWNCLDGAGFQDLTDPDLGALHYTDMSCQPQLPYALPRLAAEGRKHWYNGTVRLGHKRADVQALFDRLLEEASREGYEPAAYIPRETFGTIVKQDLSHYAGRG